MGDPLSVRRRSTDSSIRARSASMTRNSHSHACSCTVREAGEEGASGATTSDTDTDASIAQRRRKDGERRNSGAVEQRSTGEGRAEEKGTLLTHRCAVSRGEKRWAQCATTLRAGVEAMRHCAALMMDAPAGVSEHRFSLLSYCCGMRCVAAGWRWAAAAVGGEFRWIAGPWTSRPIAIAWTSSHRGERE